MSTEQKPPDNQGQARAEFVRHVSRQRRAMVIYIEEQTGKPLDAVPYAEQNRLALEWVRLYAEGFRNGSR